MGLLSKLFGDSKSADEALGALKKAAEKVAGDLVEKAEEFAGATGESRSSAPSEPAAGREPVKKASVPGEFGISWGDEMPAEENQYNYNGNFVDYFETVFREGFPQYRIRREFTSFAKPVVFTFSNESGTALVVELKSQNSSAQKLRRQCEAEGTPYLRFYHDHPGWWNTRRYVEGRVSKALGLGN